MARLHMSVSTTRSARDVAGQVALGVVLLAANALLWLLILDLLIDGFARAVVRMG